jgi:putative transposase
LRYEQSDEPLRRLPLSRRDHQPRRLVVLPLPLSFRDSEEWLATRGMVVTYETIRQGCLKFGQTLANEVRRRLPRPDDQWHWDKVYLKINGKLHYLWRAVDQDGQVLDILLQTRRDKQAAKRFFKKLLKGLRYVPRVVVIAKLRRYGAALKELLPSENQQNGNAPF